MSQETGFFHSVFFWLREGGGEADARQIMGACRRHLAGIPGVLRLTVGAPAGAPGPLADSSFGVALLIEFADGAAHDVYETHPDHLRFIAECGPLCSRVQVYDVLPQGE